MTYAFTFDAAFCSGCKACQAACKDRNNLPLGVLWRRVIEVSGGTWQRNGAAWDQTVFAYNVSISCNHCLHPKCAGVCPTGAYDLRADGIVLLDTAKCMGCGYCAWACPYGAPQYNPEAGVMTKCNFCFDDLQQGLPPACVAACPMRVLDYRPADSEMQEVKLWESPSETHPYPLPPSSHTQPHLAIRPHAAMNTAEEKLVANLEEIRPRAPSNQEEMPLILFTLFSQMAVGGFWAMLWTFPGIWNGMARFQPIPQILIGICLAAGMLASLAHLGKKKNAWRALGNLRKSWLSREILFTGLFGAGWLFTAAGNLLWHRSPIEGMALTAAFGLGLIYSMSRVYRLPAIPAWNTRQTNLVFIVSALLLGQSLMRVLSPSGSNLTGSILLVLLLAQLLLMQKPVLRSPLLPLRTGLILAGMILTLSSFLLGGNVWLSSLILLTVLAEAGIGRWAFYRPAQELFVSS